MIAPRDGRATHGIAAKTVPATLVYIAGSGHSGSTLLDMLLGGHDRIASLGEVHRFSLSLNKTTEPHHCCCGASVLGCPFWSRVVDTLREELGIADPERLKSFRTTRSEYLEIPDSVLLFRELEPLPRRRYEPNVRDALLVVGSRRLWRVAASLVPELREQREMIRSSLAVFRAVRRAWGVPIVVDSTKNPGRLKALYLEADERVRIVRLVRDGRAVCYSRMRRQNVPMRRCAEIWKAEQLKHRLTTMTIPRQRVFTARYEDLCRAPTAELRRLCEWLGIEFQASMLDFRHDRHNLGGNPMRWRANERNVRIDERWRHELQAEDLKTFEDVAGDLNRRLGYQD